MSWVEVLQHEAWDLGFSIECDGHVIIEEGSRKQQYWP